MNVDDSGGLCVDADPSPIHSPSSLVQVLSLDAQCSSAEECVGAVQSLLPAEFMECHEMSVLISKGGVLSGLYLLSACCGSGMS